MRVMHFVIQVVMVAILAKADFIVRLFKIENLHVIEVLRRNLDVAKLKDVYILAVVACVPQEVAEGGGENSNTHRVVVIFRIYVEPPDKKVNFALVFVDSPFEDLFKVDDPSIVLLS